MPNPTPVAVAAPTTLRALLKRTSGLSDDAVSEAHALGADAAGAVVAELILAELSRRTGDGTAIRAVHLAGELRLARAVPALVRCVERLADFHPLRSAVASVLHRLGSTAVDALLAALDRCRTPEARARVGEALSALAVDDDRIRAAFVRMLEDDPVNAARFLAAHGEWRAVDELSRAVDRVLRDPPDGDCAICSSEYLHALTSAIRALGGTVPAHQRAQIDAIDDRAKASWIPTDDLDGLEAFVRIPAKRADRPGRNDPCPCGSGKKYKVCHLDADANVEH